MTGTFSGAGNSRIFFVANACGLAANIALDPLLIFPLHMGVLGAAAATTASNALVAVILAAAIKKHPNRPFKDYRFRVTPDWEKIAQIWRWCMPAMLENLFFTLLSMVTTRFVTGFGADALATQRVGSQIESLSWLIGGGFGTALTVFVGQNYGAAKWGRIHKSVRLSLAAMSGWGLAVTAALYFGGRLLFSCFLNGDAILDMGEMYLKILAACQIFMCFESVGSGAFHGIGKTIPPSVISIAANGIRVPLAYALSLTSLGLYGIWIGITAGAILRGSLILASYLIAARRLPTEDRL
jgi:putative MATE family efflux protein